MAKSRNSFFFWVKHGGNISYFFSFIFSSYPKLASRKDVDGWFSISSGVTSNGFKFIFNAICLRLYIQEQSQLNIERHSPER